MRFRGMMLALSLVAWGCGDDSGSSPGQHPTDASLDAGPDTQVLSDARAADGGPIYVSRDGAIIPPPVDGGGGDASDATVSVVPVCTSSVFALETASGAAPLFERVSCAGTAANAQYDWGEGGGFEAQTTHRYKTPGTYTVTQKAGDGTTATATVTVSSFTPVRFSTTDHSSKGGYGADLYDLIGISPDGTKVEQFGIETSAVRSDAAIAPGSGVFYFEVRRLIAAKRRGGVGIATAAAPVDVPNGMPSYVLWNGTAPGTALYQTGDGTVATGSGTCSGQLAAEQADLGFVVDYRGASPKLMLLQDAGGVTTVKATCSLTLTAPVFVYYGGEHARVGYEYQINTGADTTNHPFFYQEAAVRTAVAAASDAGTASALVRGFARTNARPLDAPPSLTVPGDMTVAAGQMVTLTGSAADTEDGVLDTQIQWLDSSSQHHAPVKASGASFSFVAALGRHPVIASVTDLDGVTTEKTVMVEATGSLPQAPVVRLTPDPLSGEGITLNDPVNLSAKFNGPGKDGIRANQGIYGQYWYFEVHRNASIRNMGIGVVIGDGALNSLTFARVPWCASLNVEASAFYINLIDAGSWSYVADPDDADYGFAVDYRGTHPILHIIIHNEWKASLTLDQTWVPVYPMLYANGPNGTSDAQPALPVGDMTINFGATPFAQDPVKALTAKSIDLTGFKKGWGVHAQP
ncbi:MAG: hypothetical protein JWN48_4031 [Myxococcaceae bacterium]|nr:hypothetical protein [Myxococcaceae bacterium]